MRRALDPEGHAMQATTGKAMKVAEAIDQGLPAVRQADSAKLVVMIVRRTKPAAARAPARP